MVEQRAGISIPDQSIEEWQRFTRQGYPLFSKIFHPDKRDFEDCLGDVAGDVAEIMKLTDEEYLPFVQGFVGRVETLRYSDSILSRFQILSDPKKFYNTTLAKRKESESGFRDELREVASWIKTVFPQSDQEAVYTWLCEVSGSGAILGTAFYTPGKTPDELRGLMLSQARRISQYRIDGISGSVGLTEKIIQASKEKVSS